MTLIQYDACAARRCHFRSQKRPRPRLPAPSAAWVRRESTGPHALVPPPGPPGPPIPPPNDSAILRKLPRLDARSVRRRERAAAPLLRMHPAGEGAASRLELAHRHRAIPTCARTSAPLPARCCAASPPRPTTLSPAIKPGEAPCAGHGRLSAKARSKPARPACPSALPRCSRPGPGAKRSPAAAAAVPSAAGPCEAAVGPSPLPGQTSAARPRDAGAAARDSHACASRSHACA
jgi:hypothetical protein